MKERKQGKIDGGLRGPCFESKSNPGACWIGAGGVPLAPGGCTYPVWLLAPVDASRWGKGRGRSAPGEGDQAPNSQSQFPTRVAQREQCERRAVGGGAKKRTVKEKKIR
jgi:hypothetical protein